jgi:hypothetical protein
MAFMGGGARSCGGRTVRRAAVLGASLVVLLAFASPAAAAEGEQPPTEPPARANPTDVAAVLQYWEHIPTGAGARLTGRTSGTTPLPPQVEQRIRAQGGHDADRLIEISTSQDAGAPPSVPRAASSPGPPPGGEGSGDGGTTGDGAGVLGPERTTETPSFPEALVGAVTSEGGGLTDRFLLPFLALITGALVAGALVAWRRRSDA